MKQCEEQRVKKTTNVPKRPLAIKKSPKPPKPPTHQPNPSPWPVRPTNSKRKRPQHHTPTQRPQVLTTVQLLQFPTLSEETLRDLRHACSERKSGDVVARISTSTTGLYPITGKEMQRKSDINGKYHNSGLFNDNIIEAYLSLVEAAYSTHVKIACSSASV